MRRKENEATIKEVLEALVEQYRLRRQLDQTKLRKIWPELVGESIARHTEEIRIQRDRLILRIGPPALRQELSYGRERIRSLVNEALGEERIRKVVIL